MNGSAALSTYTFSFVIEKTASAVGNWYLDSVVVYDYFLRNTTYTSATPFFVVNSFETATTTSESSLNAKRYIFEP